MVARRRSLVALVVAALALTVGLVGAGAASSATSAASSATSKAKSKINIAAFEVARANIYDTALAKGQAAAAKKYGVNVTFFDAEFDPQKSVSQCQDALTAHKYNVFLMKAVAGVPVEPCVKQAIAQGIKVIAVDTPIGPKFVAKSQVKGLTASLIALPTTLGKSLARMTVAACGKRNPCKVAYFYGPPTFTFVADGRTEYLKVIKKHKNIQVVDQASTAFDTNKGISATQALLSAHPDVNVIVNDGDQSALGAMKVLRQQGKLATDGSRAAGKVLVIGAGGACYGVKAVQKGVQFGDPPLYPYSIGYLSVTDAVEAMTGKKIKRPFLDTYYIKEPKVGPVVTHRNAKKVRCEYG